MNKKQLIETIKNIDTSHYDQEKVYNELYNAVIDYMNETQDFRLEEYFNDFIDYDTAEEQLKYELEHGGLARVACFLEGVNLNRELFQIDGYGNLENVDREDLEILKDDLLAELED